MRHFIQNIIRTRYSKVTNEHSSHRLLFYCSMSERKCSLYSHSDLIEYSAGGSSGDSLCPSPSLGWSVSSTLWQKHTFFRCERDGCIERVGIGRTGLKGERAARWKDMDRPRKQTLQIRNHFCVFLSHCSGQPEAFLSALSLQANWQPSSLCTALVFKLQ